jgi:hypothetical protein
LGCVPRRFTAPARDIQENLFQVLATIAGKQMRR